MKGVLGTEVPTEEPKLNQQLLNKCTRILQCKTHHIQSHWINNSQFILEFCSFFLTRENLDRSRSSHQFLRRQSRPACQCELYLACFHQGLLLTALLAVGLELGEAELSEQVT